MGIDVRGVVEYMVGEAIFSQLINNPLAQFGMVDRPYLGPSLLPELEVPQNEYKEEKIRYRSIVANDGTRYSPVQKKGSVLSGSFLVSLGNSDIGSELTAQDYDAFIRLIERTTGQQGVNGGGVTRPSMQAMQNLINWSENTLSVPLQEKNELQRWQALVSAQVIRTGDNGYREVVTYPNPTGHRVAAAGQWSNNSYDPLADIMTGVRFMASLGYTVNRIITGTDVLTILSANQQIRQRLGIASIANGTIVGLAATANRQQINDLLARESLPMIETYDLKYRTQNGSGYFFPRGSWFMAATTGRDASIDLGDVQNLFMRTKDGDADDNGDSITLRDTLGYTGVGRAAGQSEPGRIILVESFTNKPPRVEGESWQTSLPVVTEPEAIYCINSIS